MRPSANETEALVDFQISTPSFKSPHLTREMQHFGVYRARPIVALPNQLTTAVVKAALRYFIVFPFLFPSLAQESSDPLVNDGTY